MKTDLTFITNEENQSLLERFKVLIKDTEFFDVLVGYFFTSGFYSIYKTLENTKKIRILIGISTNKTTYDLLQEAKNGKQQSFKFSHSQAKEQFSDAISQEMENSEDNQSIEEGVRKFIEWIKNGKLQIKAYPTDNIHAKLYIMTFKEDDRDEGRVITGSSNFTQAGFSENLEFNVELKNKADYDFAKNKFEELWKYGIDVSEKYIESIQSRTWMNDTIQPHDLYLKLLYEYFKDELTQSEEVFYKYIPIDFMKLEYQEQAVLNAKKILDEYGGVFLSDVVGLGKTYISAMLASQIDGRNLVIAPPVLLGKDNPGSWPNVFSDFRIPADFESIGKLDKLIKKGTDKYKNVIIDEAHRFRSETNITYEKLAEICKGKRVILVSATPLNNSPKDILSQIKLFQKSKKSTIPNLPNLEEFFSRLQKNLTNLDRQRDYDEFMKTIRENAKEIREKVLKYLMVRRTRSEVIKYFENDFKKQKIKFPEVADPEPVLYELNEQEDKVFSTTIELITKQFKYTRYMPMIYYVGEKLTDIELQGQRNMGRFMKILLVKRLESSFFAFNNSLKRFINSYERFITEYDKGYVYIVKKYSSKLFELLENDDEEAIEKLIEDDKLDRYKAEDFKPEFLKDLKHDLSILQDIQKLWSTINRDPKLLKFIDILKNSKVLKENRLIVFTESRETAEYLGANLKEKLKIPVLVFSGGSGASTREKVIENFDARARFKKENYRILVTTEVLSEGVNLHRSNVVINYDIPWNPTRLMQRVGRINRVDTKFDKIFTFNFFPTVQSNNLIKLKEAAEAKIQAFIEMLGVDARLLTEGEEIKSHDLFARLISKKTITGEDEEVESELKYLNLIKDIRDNDVELFERIKRLPRKARTGRKSSEHKNKLLTFFRKGKIQKFFLAKDSIDSEELDFLSAAKTLEVKKGDKRETIGKDFYELLEANKDAFRFTTSEEFIDIKPKRGGDNSVRLLKILKAVRSFKGFTEDQEDYLDRVIQELNEGGLPKQTIKTTLKAFEKESGLLANPLKAVGLLKINISDNLLKDNLASKSTFFGSKREVILSEYLIG
ncbi:MAG: helicase-related protein [Acidobacteriota bacterium]